MPFVTHSLRTETPIPCVCSYNNNTATTTTHGEAKMASIEEIRTRIGIEEYGVTNVCMSFLLFLVCQNVM